MLVWQKMGLVQDDKDGYMCHLYYLDFIGFFPVIIREDALVRVEYAEILRIPFTKRLENWWFRRKHGLKD